jgi:hypothetical protein
MILSFFISSLPSLVFESSCNDECMARNYNIIKMRSLTLILICIAVSLSQDVRLINEKYHKSKYKCNEQC